MKIELLYFDGCPNVESTARLLAECLTQEGVRDPIQRVLISNEEEASKWGFLGSPSILIDGMDIELSRRGETPGFGCRIYTGSGATSGEPPKRLIVDAIRLARART